jgi:hypothetical protein
MKRSASPEEAAAIAAAIERFTAETAPQPPAVETAGAWTRAALLEGVGAKLTIQEPEGGMR